MLTPRVLGEERPKIKKHLNKLIENNKKGLTFNLGEIPESEMFSLIKLAIKEKIDWDIDSNIGLIPETKIIEIAELIIESGKGFYVAKNLDKIPETKIVEVVKLLIKTEDGFRVAYRLEKIPETKIVEVVKLLIEAMLGDHVAGNLGKITERHIFEIAELLINAGEARAVSDNLDKIPEHERVEIAKILIEARLGAYVAENLGKIPEHARFEIAKLIIKAKRDSYKIAYKLHLILVEEHRLELVKLLINAGCGSSVARNLDKIPETKIAEIVKLIIEKGEGKHVARNLDKIPETKIVEVVDLLIEVGEARAVAGNLDKIPETKIIKVVKLLIEAGEEETVVDNLEKITESKIIEIVTLLTKAEVAYYLDKIPETKIVEVAKLLIEAGEIYSVVNNLHKIPETKIAEVINLLIEKGLEYKPLLIYFVKYKNEIKKENIIKINEYIKQNYPFNDLEEMKIYTEQKVKDFWNSKMFDINEKRNSLVTVMIAKDVPGISKEGVEGKLEEYKNTNIEKPFDISYTEKEIEVSLTKIEFKGISDDIQKNINTLKSIVNEIDLNKPEQFSEIYNQIKNKLENIAIDERDIKTIKLKNEVLEIIYNLKHKNIPELLSKVNFLSQKKNLDISNDLRKIVILYSLRKEHNRFSTLKSCLNNDITIESLKEIEEIISELITNGNLSKYLGKSQQAKIRKLLYCSHFENEIKSNKKVNLNDKTKIKLHFSKDYLTNFAKSISCTCYSKINILKEAPNATSIIFFINDKPAGSCILQDTLDKDDNKITIISGLNPQNSYLTKINCQEFVSSFLEVIKDTCIKRKTIPCIILDGVNRRATNRDDIWKQLEPHILENKKIEAKNQDEINYGSSGSEGDIYRL